MRRMAVAGLCLLLAGIAIGRASMAVDKPEIVTVRSIARVYDGDTFHCNLIQLPAALTDAIGIRVNGIDCPELRDKRPEIKRVAIAAREFTAAALAGAKTIELTNIKRGKYFRLVADVIVDGDNLTQKLIAAGLAKPYDGGKRPKWFRSDIGATGTLVLKAHSDIE